MGEALTYQTILHVGGHQLIAVNGYDDLRRRLRDARVRFGGEGGGDMAWPEPIEITIRGQGPDGDCYPYRALIQPQAISAVIEIPERARERVQTGPPAF